MRRHLQRDHFNGEEIIRKKQNSMSELFDLQLHRTPAYPEPPAPSPSSGSCNSVWCTPWLQMGKIQCWKKKWQFNAAKQWYHQGRNKPRCGWGGLIRRLKILKLVPPNFVISVSVWRSVPQTCLTWTKFDITLHPNYINKWFGIVNWCGCQIQQLCCAKM